MGGWLAGRGWFKKRHGSFVFFEKRERSEGQGTDISSKRETARTQHPDLIYKLLLMANKCCGCVFANKRKGTVRSQHLPQTKSRLSCFYSLKHTLT